MARCQLAAFLVLVRLLFQSVYLNRILADVSHLPLSVRTVRHRLFSGGLGTVCLRLKETNQCEQPSWGSSSLPDFLHRTREPILPFLHPIAVMA